jgi:hypothetical protein
MKFQGKKEELPMLLQLTKILPVLTKDARRKRKGSKGTLMNIRYVPISPHILFFNTTHYSSFFSKNVEVLLLSINTVLQRNLKRKTWGSGIMQEIWVSEEGSWTMIKGIKC